MPLPESLYGPQSSVVITGASSGIGAALAIHLAQYRGRLALVARRAERLQEVAARVRDQGAEPLIIEGDVADLEQVKENQRCIVDNQGPITVAFLNAGLGNPTRLTRFDAAHLKRVYGVNVFGVAHWLEVLLPDMISRKQGVLAATSSLAAARGLPGVGAYASSKAAVSSLLESLRLEAGQYGIQISVVEPGYVRSEMTAPNKFKMPFLMDPEEAAREITDAVADGRTLIRFPWQMAAAMQIIRHLPRPLFDKMHAGQVRKKG